MGSYNSGVFVTFEGPEGAGKSTAIQAVAESLRASGRSVVVTREPGAGSVGVRIRQILLDPDIEAMSARCELFLFLADRAQHVAHLIGPALAEGSIVLCDRFSDSTLVYQGYGRGLDLDELRTLNRIATAGLEPELTLLIDVPAEVGLARVSQKDRLDGEPIEFHRRVRDGFLAEAAREPGRWRILDGSQCPEAVARVALDTITAKLGLPPTSPLQP